MKYKANAPSGISSSSLAHCLGLTFPPVMVQLVQELVTPAPAFDVIGRILESDPMLSATMLTLVNSPYYGLTSKVTDLERAAVVLGTREILKMALSISFQHNTSGAIRRDKSSQFADWRLSVWSSIAAEQIASRIAPKEAHLAYLGSLLKDLSLFLYLCMGQNTIEDATCTLWLEDEQLATERSHWGETHEGITSTLLAEWGLPDSILHAIAHHHDLLRLEEHPPLTRSIILATRWAELQHGKERDTGSIIQFEIQMRSLLKLDDVQLEALRKDCTLRYESMLSLLGIQNVEPDTRFYAQSLQSMQSYYFHAMEISHAERGVEGIGKTILRQMRWNWGMEQGELALRNPSGGFLFFSLHNGETVITPYPDMISPHRLPWMPGGEKLIFSSGSAAYGQVRFLLSKTATPSEQDLHIYAHFVSGALGTYYNERAAMVTKAQTLQALPIGVALADMSGMILDANAHFLSYRGVTEPVVGEDVSGLLHRRLGVVAAPLIAALLEDPERQGISRLFCSAKEQEGSAPPCVYLSIHRHTINNTPALLVMLEDVTEISAMEVQVLRQHDFLEQLVSSMRELIATVDSTGTILWTSPRAAHLRGKNLFTVASPTSGFSGAWDESFLAERVIHCRDGNPTPPVEVILPSGSLATSRLELLFSPLRGADDTPTTYLVVGRDLTLIRRLEDKIRKQAMYDGLTGLFNYSQFNVVLAREVERSRRTGRGLGLIFFDLDKFKQVNDGHGHQTGDRLLRLIARAIMESVRKGMDFPCRYGGDEFAIVVTEIGEDALHILCDRLHTASARLTQGAVSLSMGAAMLQNGETGDQLLQRADQASYDSKNAGGGQTFWAK